MSYTQPILYAAREGYVPAKLYTGGIEPFDSYRFVDATPLSWKPHTITLEALESIPVRRQQLALLGVSGPLATYNFQYSGCLWIDLPLFAAEMTKIEHQYGRVDYTFKTDAKC